MARAMWKGYISFGLVNIPVELHSVEKRIDLSFHLIDSRNNARVRYERVNDVTGKEVPWDKIVKGYEFQEGNYVLLTDKDFERAAVEATKTVEIEDFVDAKQVGFEYFDKPYIFVPSGKGEKPYVLLREALKASGKIGIAKVVIRTRQYLAAVTARDDALYLFVLRFPNEIKKTKEFDLPAESLNSYKVSQKEIDMALQLIKSMTSPWKPEQYHDEYREALMEWIEKKADAGGVEIEESEKEVEMAPTTNVVNIMDLLKKSMRSGSTNGEREKTKHRAKGEPAHAKSKARAHIRKKAS